jgi:glycosyltransferase involved in cell wall biosynthesis
MSDLVSVIIPCYKQAHFLKECVKSLQSQTFYNWEAIIVDDGSPDNTKEVATQLTLEDKRIRYLHKPNGGLSSARNTGITASSGQFIQLLDADDRLDCRKLEVHAKFLSRTTNIDLVYGNASYFYDGNASDFHRGPYALHPEHDWIKEYWEDPRPVLAKLVERNIFPVCAPLFRRSVFDRVGYFNEALAALEDWEYWIRCAIEDIEFEYFSGIGTDAFVRRHQASMTADIRSPEIQLASYRLREICHENLSPGYERKVNLCRLLRANSRLGKEGIDSRYGTIRSACISNRERLIVTINKLCDVGSFMQPVALFFGSRLPWRLRRRLADMGFTFVDL